MPRLLVDARDDLASRFDAFLIQQKLREQAERDHLLDRIGSLVLDGWFSSVVARNCSRLASARPHLRSKIAADNQARLIRTFHQSKQIIEVHDAAESAEDHGLQPKDLKNRASGKRKRRRDRKPGTAAAWPWSAT